MVYVVYHAILHVLYQYFNTFLVYRQYFYKISLVYWLFSSFIPCIMVDKRGKTWNLFN